MTHEQKITFGEMRKMGVHDVLIYCRDPHMQSPHQGQRRPLARSRPAVRYRTGIRLYRLR
jgi:hypothetical protein